jgi:hypothetical protein
LPSKYKIAEIIIFNSFFGPLIRYLQLDVKFKQRCHAPFAPNFIKQKSFFSPEVAEVGEYFAQNNSIFFVAMFYMPIFPLGGLYASAGLVMRYWVDKHALLRRWARQPDMGSSMVDSSNMQLVTCLLAALLMGQRYYAAWPFDNQCPDLDDPGSYHVCDRWQGRLIFQHEDYMTRDQQASAAAFALTFVILTAVLVVYYLVFASYYSVKSCFWVSATISSTLSILPILLVTPCCISLPCHGCPRGLTTAPGTPLKTSTQR